MPLTADQIGDLLKGTLEELGKGKRTFASQQHQNYEVYPKIMKKDKVIVKGGTGLQRNLQLDRVSAARNVGLFDSDNINVQDTMYQINVPWRHTTTNYAFDRRELAMNEHDPHEIYNLVKTRRDAAMLSKIELMESDFFGKPTDSSDKTTPWGLYYWIVKNATQGFNGGNPAGFSDVAGLDHANYKNYTDTYSAVTKADLIKNWRRAFRKTGFKSPISVSDYRTGNGQRFRNYVNLDLITALEDLGESQNENLGRDLASMDGNMNFRGTPIVWIPSLDDQTDDPLYMIDFNAFGAVVLRGEYMREEPKQVTAGQHTVYEVHVDTTYNYLCVDRRSQAVIYKA